MPVGCFRRIVNTYKDAIKERWKYTAWLIMGTFCAFQLMKLIINYRKHETNTRVDSIHPEEVSPPQINSCYHFEQFDGYETATTDTDFLNLGPTTQTRSSSDATPNSAPKNSMKRCEDMVTVSKFLKRNEICYSFDFHPIEHSLDCYCSFMTNLTFIA